MRDGAEIGGRGGDGSSAAPRVSVVIPTLGRPQLVARAVASALGQTVPDVEVVAVVDGPDPATRAALAAIPDPRLRVIEHPERRGAAAARDLGVSSSRGAWIAFLDDDDAWMPRKLEAQLALADGMRKPAIVSALSLVGTPGAGRVKPARPYAGREPFAEWLFDRPSWLGEGGFVQSSSLLVSRGVFDTQKFADTGHHDDWEFVIRAVDGGCAFATVPEPLVEHLFDGARASLQSTLTWRKSLDWALGMGAALTPRARAGFLLTVAARAAANAGAREAALPLAAAAFRHGRPTARQLFAFALLWLVPGGLRRALRRRAPSPHAPSPHARSPAPLRPSEAP